MKEVCYGDGSGARTGEDDGAQKLSVRPARLHGGGGQGGGPPRPNDHTQVTYLKPGLLDRKTKELLIIVACVASGDLVSHIQIHMHAAQKAGATPEEIMEALNFVGSWIGVRRLLGLEAWRATFRPDLPTIDRVVELK